MSTLVTAKTPFFQSLMAVTLCVLIMLAWQILPHPVIILAIGFAPLAVLLVLHKPFLFVLLFVVFSFFRIHEVFPQIYNFKIPLMLSMASLGALLWHVGLTRRFQPYWSKELSVATAFFVLVFIGVAMASNRPVAIEYFKGIYWKIALMTYAIAWLSCTVKDFALASRLITLSGALVGCVALYNAANGIGLVEGTRITIGREFGSVLGDPNDLSLVLLFPTSFAVGLLLTRGLGFFSRLLGFVSIPILFAAIIATQSRGGLLGMLAVFGVYGYRRVKSKTLFIGISVVAAVALYLLADISGRASGGAAEAGVDASAMGRIYAWQAAFGMALDNPFTGVGLDNFYSNYFYYSPHWDGLNHAVHSTWFGVLAETGFLGLAVFIGFIALLIKSSLATLRRVEQFPDQANPVIHVTAQALLAGLIGTVVSGTFLTQGFTWPIYILAALVVAVARWAEKNLQN